MTVTLTGETGVRIETVTDYQDTQSEFTLNANFTRHYGNSKMAGTMSNNCTMPHINTILCR